MAVLLSLLRSVRNAGIAVQHELHLHDARNSHSFGSFDLIVSSGVFQYFSGEDIGAVLKFAFGNLKPGGPLAFSGPGCSDEAWMAPFNGNLYALSDGLLYRPPFEMIRSGGRQARAARERHRLGMN